MYLHKVVNLDKNLSKVQKNKELHKAAFNLLEENLIKRVSFKERGPEVYDWFKWKAMFKKRFSFF